MAHNLDIDGRVTIPAHELRWTAVRASGPGGQNVNKLATKVTLRFNLPASTALGQAVRERLCALARPQLDAHGYLVLTSQATRSQAANLADAEAKLVALIRQALTTPTRRRPTRPRPGARRRRLEAKRQRSEKKNGRARIRSSEY